MHKRLHLIGQGRTTMSKILITLLLTLLCKTTFADQEAQDLCIAQFSNQCQVKCQETNDINCAKKCQDDAVNQCRQAGE